MLLYKASLLCRLVFGPLAFDAICPRSVTWPVPSLAPGRYRLEVEGWTDREGGIVWLELAHTLAPVWVAAWSLPLPATLAPGSVAVVIRVRTPVAAPAVRLTRCAASVDDTAVGTFRLTRVTLTALPDVCGTAVLA